MACSTIETLSIKRTPSLVIFTVYRLVSSKASCTTEQEEEVDFVSPRGGFENSIYKFKDSHFPHSHRYFLLSRQLYLTILRSTVSFFFFFFLLAQNYENFSGICEFMKRNFRKSMELGILFRERVLSVFEQVFKNQFF